MFKRTHHLRIATVLQSLDAEVLLQYGCLFGGGTAIVLKNGEYRESVDIDFLVSEPAGYRELRQLMKKSDDLSPITKSGLNLSLSRTVRVDQYGIRTMIKQGDHEIKFEIINEARILLEAPLPEDRICGIGHLTQIDMAASKLLANSDRWRHDAVFSRDLIDLAMLELTPEELIQAIEKSEMAYGETIQGDLKKAIQNLKGRSGRLHECMAALKIEIPEVVIWEKIRKLGQRV